MLVTAVSCLGCSRTVVVAERPREVVVVKEEKGGRSVTARKLGIPPGHLPAPGKCRVWLPGVPPGRQPKAGSCGQMRDDVPAGAWLIERSKRNPDVVRVTESDRRDADVIVAVRVYEIASGKCVSEQ